MSNLTVLRGGDLQHYDPEKGLKKVAAHKAIEEHYARAKDVEQLREACECKLREQARYVIWRDAQYQNKAGPGRGNKTKRESANGFPESDPGHDVIYRWRKKLCSKDDNDKTYANDDKIEIAISKAVERCVKACEGAPRIPKDEPEESPTLVQEECDNCDTVEERWVHSFGNLAGDIVAARAYWRKEFPDWEKFEVTSSMVNLAKQAAVEWEELYRDLSERSKRK